MNLLRNPRTSLRPSRLSSGVSLFLALAVWACSNSDEADSDDSGSGGATTGGSSASGGASGGAATGGAPNSGGGAVGGSGGVVGTGGAASGGAGTGGAGTGGAGTGGAGGSGGSASVDACSTTSGLEAEFSECFSVQLANGLDAARSDAVVFVNLGDINAAHPDFNSGAFVVTDGTTELPSQTVDRAPAGSPNEIAFLVDLGPNESKTVAVRYATAGSNVRTYTQRAQALVSPKTGGSWSGDTYTGGSYMDVESLDLTGHIDHDYDYMRFEGPGWESDRIGYRTYADRRNAMDIFGKKLPGMILHEIDYVNEDYSSMSDWGMDILKVGDALGIGAIGTWESGSVTRISTIASLSVDILESGPIVALLRISYGDWQTSSGTVSLTADISITAGSRLSKVEIQAQGTVANLCTGIAKHDGTTMIPAATTTGWNFLANYGPQSILPDDLGLAVLYHSSDLNQVTEDSINHVVVLSPPAANTLTYYFLGGWVQEGQGLANQSEFTTYLNSTLQELDSPVSVTIF